MFSGLLFRRPKSAETDEAGTILNRPSDNNTVFTYRPPAMCLQGNGVNKQGHQGISVKASYMWLTQALEFCCGVGNQKSGEIFPYVVEPRVA